MQPIDELPPDMWNEIIAFMREEETLLTMTQVSKGTQDAAEHELTRRWVEQGFVLATGPKELAAALDDPEAKVIIARGGTVDTEPANLDAVVVAAGPVEAAGYGKVYVRDAIGTITSVTGGLIYASGAARVSNVTRGTVTARDSAQVINVAGGIVRAYGSVQVTGVTRGNVYAFDSAQVTDVTNGQVHALNNARVSATGGEIQASEHATVHSDGAKVYVSSADAMITATGGEIHLNVPNAQIIYSGDVTFYNADGEPIDPPGADDA